MNTPSEIMPDLKEFRHCFQFEDESFLVTVKDSDENYHLVRLSSNGSEIKRTPSPIEPMEMIRLEDGDFAISNFFGGSSPKRYVCNFEGERKYLIPIDWTFVYFKNMTPLINGNILAKVCSGRNWRFEEYTPSGESVRVLTSPQCAVNYYYPIAQLENENIVMEYHDYERKLRELPIRDNIINAKLDDGIFIKIFSPDLKTEVATLILLDEHTNSTLNEGLRFFKAKTCWTDDGHEPLLAVAFTGPETGEQVWINIYELNTYHKIHTVRPNDSLFSEKLSPGGRQLIITDFGFKQALSDANYTTAEPRFRCGPMW